MRIIIQNLIAHPEDWNLTGFRRLRPEVLLASQALVLWSKKLVSVSLNFKVLIYQSYIVVSHKKKKTSCSYHLLGLHSRWRALSAGLEMLLLTEPFIVAKYPAIIGAFLRHFYFSQEKNGSFSLTVFLSFFHSFIFSPSPVTIAKSPGKYFLASGTDYYPCLVQIFCTVFLWVVFKASRGPLLPMIWQNPWPPHGTLVCLF